MHRYNIYLFYMIGIDYLWTKHVICMRNISKYVHKFSDVFLHDKYKCNEYKQPWEENL